MVTLVVTGVELWVFGESWVVTGTNGSTGEVWLLLLPITTTTTIAVKARPASASIAITGDFRSVSAVGCLFFRGGLVDPGDASLAASRSRRPLLNWNAAGPM